MGSPQSQASADLARQSASQAQGMYSLGIPALKGQYGLLESALGQGGEPQYLKDAFTQQRVGLTEGALTQERLGASQGAAKAKMAMAGGNMGSVFDPGRAGSMLANTLYTSRLQEGMGRIDEMNKLTGMSLGQTQQAGSAALGAAGNALGAIGMMPQYNPTYASILGGADLARIGYGMGKKAGWWGGGQQSLVPGQSSGTGAPGGNIQ